jgi:hypothetical protein
MSANQPATLMPMVNVSVPPLGKWEREFQAFQRLLPELQKTHLGKYVAVHEERIVDSDQDEIAFILRVHAKHGYVPIHVERVTIQAPAPIRVPHYREYRLPEES